MTRDLILGTAGHIDHGKTSLVKAITGIDCDRLPEEKARGITIDIGFARLPLSEYQVGIVDCPGHERFIKNMLAGATGIDMALLIVAADDSVMPQTREHLEILRLLGLRHGVIALTKADLVDETTREIVELNIRELVAGSFLADAPIIPTSIVSGMGLPELREALTACAAQVVLHEDGDAFRMAIDRAFTVPGHGTVVTGSVTSGQLRIGDDVEWLPSGERVRVRSLHNHDHAVEVVHRGQRAAINLAGVPHEAVKRGQELATPGYLVPSRVLTVRLQALKSNRKALKHRTEVRLHIGTAETLATLSLLDCDHVDAGQQALAQLFVSEPVMGVWGQPFVLRDSSAEHTLGGGLVLQPVANKIRRRHIEVLERVEQLVSDDPARRVPVVVWFGGLQGATLADIARGAGISAKDMPTLPNITRLKVAGQEVFLHADRRAELEERVLTILGKLHADFPLLTYHDRSKVLATVDYTGVADIVQGVIEQMLQTKQLVGDAKRLARADFKPKLSVNQRKLKDQIVEATKAAGFQPPEPSSFAAKAAGNAGALKDIYEVAVAEGLLVRITPDIYLHADTEATMRQRLQAKTANGVGVTVAEIRDLLGTTRKFAVPICEYLDRVKITRRAGDLRFWQD